MNPKSTSKVKVGLVTQAFTLANSASFEMVPVLLFILYIIGFLCLNTHLSKFPIIETNIISLNYIKASLVFIVFNVPIISVARKSVYGFENAKLSNFVIVLYLIDFYCIIYFVYESLTIYHADKLSEGEAYLRLKVVAVTYITFFVGWIFHKTRNSMILSCLVFLIAFNVVGFCIFSYACLIISLYIFVACIIFFVIFFIDIRKPERYDGNKSLFIPSYGIALALIIISFGWFVYNKIPQILGGGKAYSATLYLTKAEFQNLNESCVFGNDEAMQSQIKIVYSSDKGFYIDENSGIIIIPIESIKGIRVKRWILSNE